MTEILLDPSNLLLLAGVGFFAGFIDAIVGGGGLLTVPALLSIGLSPHLTLGTNKLAASFGSATAALTYFKKNLFDPNFWRHSFYNTLLGALVGTIFINLIQANWLDKFLPVLIFIVALYTLFNRLQDIDNHVLPKKNQSFNFKQRCQAFVLGFYDGAAGPGTGAFWVISSMRLYKINILLASGLAKSMNFTSNITALLIFIYFDQVDWVIGFTMGACIMLGAYIGAHSAIRFGSKFIRPIFICVVLIMSIKLGYSAWFA
ncbi:TSUP family transporter [Psychromonas sp. CD1]|uniref:TSUP family transporter n=1 Tax=Psychromonas sp. CD1 TaxID=1979839 RepID=UPI000B9B2D31|nr:TSUP family transporter [Psychromonas sp. CD1]